uniref:Uncharacterized protein n=1 Tax=Bubo bubo TaxID=30461 RepID=A0A8C0FS26_BUBBB
MCTPLLLQDKTNLVEDYVGEYPELQSKLLQILDTWCEPGFNIRDITRYKPDKFNRKMLSKLVFRLLDRFNVDPEQMKSICLLPCSARNLCCNLSWGVSGFN